MNILKILIQIVDKGDGMKEHNSWKRIKAECI